MDKKILIIEDEVAIQKILSEPLTFAGYKVTTASDGLEGINYFHEQDFDLILLDILLPKIDGYEIYWISACTGYVCKRRKKYCL